MTKTTKRHKNPADPRKEGFLPSVSFLKKFETMTPRKVRYSRMEEKKGKFDSFGNKKEAKHFIEGRLGEGMLNNPENYMDNFFILENEVDEDTSIFKLISAYFKLKKTGKSNDPLGEAYDIIGNRSKLETIKANLDAGAYDEKIKYLEARESGNNFISPSLHDEIKNAIDYAKKNSPIEKIISESETSKFVTWINQMTGVKCVGEIDLLRKRGITDIKVLIDISPEAVLRYWGTFRKRGYLEQVAAYMEAVGLLKYEDGNVEIQRGKEATLFCIEKKPPFGWKEYPISNDDLHMAYQKFSGWCAKYKHVQENDLWEMGYQYDEIYQMTGYKDDENFPKFMEERPFPELTKTEIYS